jgi:hypothetical protein
VKDPIDTRPDGDAEESVDDPGRRWLLRTAVYVAPTIVSVVAVNKAHAQTSCAPQSCAPGCVPGQGCNPSSCNPNSPCGPDTCMPP